MKNFTDLPAVPSDHLVPFADQLRLAVAACLPRPIQRRLPCRTESDLRCYLITPWPRRSKNSARLEPSTTDAVIPTLPRTREPSPLERRRRIRQWNHGLPSF
jgi:hypothetical protein